MDTLIIDIIIFTAGWTIGALSGWLYGLYDTSSDVKPSLTDPSSTTKDDFILCHLIGTDGKLHSSTSMRAKHMSAILRRGHGRAKSTTYIIDREQPDGSWLYKESK